ncbi:Histone-lysine N-methyltransferase SETMAR [Eumeta japonica]|uniref:Histone-lysine N-methyltransferase SETMAR n=1 Tax=Eumeta variegata TaxID=151549 RepID=A0A4C1T623_EUMVA|nr:Histone-lysine N-methyltransferase SETMAR [Eumeta japonica]
MHDPSSPLRGPTSNVIVHALPPDDDRGHLRGVDDAAVEKRGMRSDDQDRCLFPGRLPPTHLDGHPPGQLMRLKQEVEKKRLELINNFYHDNARPHTSITTQQIFREFDSEVLMHPLCSSDLIPSDFHLFRFLQNSSGRFLIGSRYPLRRIGIEIGNGMEVETECRIGIRMKIATEIEIRNTTATRIKSGNDSSIARSFTMKDEGIHSTSTRAKSGTEREKTISFPNFPVAQISHQALTFSITVQSPSD